MFKLFANLDKYLSCLHAMEKYKCKEGGNHRCKITIPKDI